LGVFVRLASPAAIDALRAAGADIGTVIGDIATARVPLDALPRLAASAGILSIEAARVARVRHDSSMAAIGVSGLRRVIGNDWSGATGQGAIVAIYDTGLDLDHPDFLAPDGQTRVLGVWDQASTVSNPPSGFNRGFYCSRAAVQQRIDGNASACPQEDNQGHGTHVAGTAAGDGSAAGSDDTPFRYAGVAPKAELLIVKGGPGVFFEDLIVQGLAWLKQEGQRLGKPVVVNLSLGGSFGPHDGTRLYERAIDNLSGPGFIVVISAGNNGSNANTMPADEDPQLMHARGFATGTTARDFEVVVPPYTPTGNRCNGNFINLDFWYEASEQLRIEVIRPGGSGASAVTGQLTSDDAAGGHIEIDNGSGGVDPENGDYEALIAFDGCGPSGATPESGSWIVRVTPIQPGANTPYDMWIFRSQLGTTVGSGALGGAGFDNQFIVS
ncbi:MAG: S8 family serine peptidase, partial [Longimicrobiales bacterium]